MTSLNVLFCPTNSPKSKNIQLTLMLRQGKAAHDFFFFLLKIMTYLMIIKLVADQFPVSRLINESTKRCSSSRISTNLHLFECDCSYTSLCAQLRVFTFFFFGASALPSRTAWCLRTPLALKMMSSLSPPSSVGVQVTVRLNEPSGCKHRWVQGGQNKKH